MTSYILSAFKIYFSNYSGLSRSSWQGIVLCFINALLGDAFYFLSVYFVNTLHIKIASSGIIIGCYGFGAIFGGFIGGKLSDKFSPRFIQLFSLFLQSIGYFVLIRLRSVEFLMADTFILGLAAYAFITANYLSVLNQTSAQEHLKLRAINLMSMSSNLGLAISAALIGTFATYSFEYIFYVVGFLFFLSFCYLAIKKDNAPYDAIHNKTKQTEISTTQTNTNNSIIWLILFCVFFTGIAVSQMSSTYSIYLNNSFPSMGYKSVSILFALNSLIVVLFEAPLVGLFNKQNKILMVGIGSLLIGLGLSILNFAFVFAIAVLACIVYTIGEMIFFSMAQFVCYQKGKTKKKGQSMGLYRMFYASSRVVGPITGTFIYSQLGGNMVWYACGAIGVLCMLMCSYYKLNDT